MITRVYFLKCIRQLDNGAVHHAWRTRPFKSWFRLPVSEITTTVLKEMANENECEINDFVIESFSRIE